jgi:hypothetical protein
MAGMIILTTSPTLKQACKIPARRLTNIVNSRRLGASRWQGLPTPRERYMPLYKAPLYLYTKLTHIFKYSLVKGIIGGK